MILENELTPGIRLQRLEH